MPDQDYNGIILEDKWGKTYLCSNCLFAYADLGQSPITELKDNIYGRYFLHDLEPATEQRSIWAKMYQQARPSQFDLSRYTNLQLRDSLIDIFSNNEMWVWPLSDGWGQQPESNGIGEGGLSSTVSGGSFVPPVAKATLPKGGAITAASITAAEVANYTPSTLLEPLNAIKDRQLRYLQRQQLLANTSGIPALKQANVRLDFNNDNILRAEAAQYVYKVDEYNRGAIDVLPEPPVGLKVISPESIGLKQEHLTNKQSGFGAAIFESKINGETMLTYRGTNNAVTGKQDWLTNLKQGSGLETEQYNQAMRLASRTQDIYGDDLSIVGHSLGGGLASAGVAVTGQPGYTFNSAGLHPNTVKRQGGLSIDAVSDLITTQAVKGEVLTMAQSLGTKAVLSGAVAAIGGPVAGLLTAIGISAFNALPKASGTMLDLPSVNGGNPVTRHGMDQVITGIEAQKTEDIQMLSSYSKAYNG